MCMLQVYNAVLTHICSRAKYYTWAIFFGIGGGDVKYIRNLNLEKSPTCIYWLGFLFIAGFACSVLPHPVGWKLCNLYSIFSMIFVPVSTTEVLKRGSGIKGTLEKVLLHDCVITSPVLARLCGQWLIPFTSWDLEIKLPERRGGAKGLCGGRLRAGGCCCVSPHHSVPLWTFFVCVTSVLSGSLVRVCVGRGNFCAERRNLHSRVLGWVGWGDRWKQKCLHLIFWHLIR